LLTASDAIRQPTETSQIHRAFLSQPICTAIQVALIELLEHWGITPKVVVGHSSGNSQALTPKIQMTDNTSGEMAAAVAAGHISAEEAIVIAYYRGYVVSKTQTPPGLMMAVGISHEEGLQYLANHHLEGTLRVACVNSPQSITISGDEYAIDRLYQIFQEKRIFSQKLKTDGKAYHSAHMKLVSAEYELLLSDAGIGSRTAPFNPSRSVKMISSVTENEVTAKKTNRANYWSTNLEAPVLFSGAASNALSQEDSDVIEIGPSSGFALLIKQIRSELQPAQKGTYMHCMSRGKNSVTTALRLAGQLYLHGHKVQFDNVNQLGTKRTPGNIPRVMTGLPKYRWAYDAPLWAESRISSDYRYRQYPRHDLLGSLLPGNALETPTWRNIMKLEHVPWLRDHRLGETVVFPAAGYLTMAIEAFSQTTKMERSSAPIISLQAVHILQTLSLPSGPDGIEVFTQLRPKRLSALNTSANWWDFEISSVQDGQSTVHATGVVGTESSPTNIKVQFDEISPMRSQSTRLWYDKFEKEGNGFGPQFQSLKDIKNNELQDLAQSSSMTCLLLGGGAGKHRQSTYFIHPITVDALLQTASLVKSGGIVEKFRSQVPVAIGHMNLSPQNVPGPGDECCIRAVADSISIAASTLSIELLSSKGDRMLEMNGVRMVSTPGFKSLDATKDETQRQPMLRVCWKPDVSKSSFGQKHFEQHLQSFTLPAEVSQGSSSSLNRLAGALRLVAHKYPAQSIMEVAKNDSITDALLETLHVDGLKMFGSYSQAQLNNDGSLRARQLVNGPSKESNASFVDASPSSKFDVLVQSEVSWREISF
jgi:acyl transferase domain-containing protein